MHNPHPYIYSGLPDRQRLMSRLGRRTDDVEIIIGACCETLEVSRDEIASKNRTRRVAEARCIAIGLILSVRNDITLNEVGRIFGGRDHSTIIYNRKLYDDLYGNDRSFTEKTDKVLILV